MNHYTLVWAYGLLACGLASMGPAAAECDRETVPLVGSEQPVVRGASSDSIEQRSQQNQEISPTDSLAGVDRESREAVNRLAIMYARGRGLPRKPRLALKLFRTLAMEGYTPAMVNLGTIYELGLASRRDHRLAYAWIRAGLTLGVPEQDRDATVFKLGMIAARLGTTQTHGAERLATNITEAIAMQCERRDRRYAEAIFTVTSP
jgi:TPR repeat protein